MIYIFLSISCSVTVAVLLKLARRYRINVLQAVLWNYLFAIVFSCIFFRPAWSNLVAAPNTIALALGFLLPLVFLMLAASVRNIGIVKTDIAQRLSLFIPVLASLFLFGESFNGLKIAGLLVGFAAIFFTLIRKQTTKKVKNSSYLYPLLVFFGFGVIDVLFKQLALHKAIPYTTSLIFVFCMAFVVALAAVIYSRIVKNEKLQLVNLLCGAILGFFNFGNILFYMKAHQALATNPTTVFAAMNMGVIILGGLVGVFFFREKLSKLNYIGLGMALVAIILITLSQLYVI